MKKSKPAKPKKYKRLKRRHTYLYMESFIQLRGWDYFQSLKWLEPVTIEVYNHRRPSSERIIATLLDNAAVYGIID